MEKSKINSHQRVKDSSQLDVGAGGASLRYLGFIGNHHGVNGIQDGGAVVRVGGGGCEAQYSSSEMRVNLTTPECNRLVKFFVSYGWSTNRAHQ